jgi:hypothetical protein
MRMCNVVTSMRGTPDMIRTALLGLSIAIAGTSGVHAQIRNDAADLAADCGHKWPESAYFSCAGYITGVLDVLRTGMTIRQIGGATVAVAATDGSGPAPLCVAIGMTPDDLAKGYVKFVEEHPEKRHNTAQGVVADALIAMDEAAATEALVSPITWQLCGRKKVP